MAASEKTSMSVSVFNTKQQCDRHRAGRQVQDFPRKKVPRCGSMWIYGTSGVHFCGKCAKHVFSGVPRQQQTYYDGSNPANHVGYIYIYIQLCR